MAKGVLGNDPFQRGAATRDGAPAKPGPHAKQERSPSERGTSDDKKKAANTRASSGPSAAHARNDGTLDKGRAKKPSSAKPAPAKSTGGAKGSTTAAARSAGEARAHSGGGASASRTGVGTKQPQGTASRGTAGSKVGDEAKLKANATPPDAKVKHASNANAKAPSRTNGAKGPKDGASAAARQPSEAGASQRASGAGHQAPASASRGARARQGDESAASVSEENRDTLGQDVAATRPADTSAVPSAEVEPLREPAAPVTPREPPPARAPALDDANAARTPHQREVDHALAEALAAEVAEVTAKHAVDVAMNRRDGSKEPVDRLLATEMATELAEAAVEEVLDHSPSTRRPERERELAATVAAQVAESAAELAVAEVMDRRAPFTHSRDTLEERAANNTANEPDADQGSRLEPHEDLAGAVLELSDLDETPDDADDVWELSSPPLSTTRSSLEPEVEMPDATRDEFPPGRRGPLSLVPASAAEDAARAAQAPDGSRESDAPRPLAQRATGMLSLAREIAGQALASEGLGRAWGAMNGMLDAVRAGLGTGGGAHLDEYGKDPSLVQRLEPVLEFLYGQYWRVAAQGTDHIPKGAAILVANHSGALPYDGLVMSLTLARERPDLRESRWLVEDQIFHAPVLGTLFNRLGAVRACPENALRLLDEQRPLVVFPEGYQGLSKPFAERYRLKRFGRGGFVKLALRTGAPIVPVAIVGAEETSPLLGRIPASFFGLPYVPLTPLGPLPAKWSIRFGEPIAMDGLPPEAAEDLGEVGRLTERTREAIQSMIHTLLRERRSIFAG
ncbi:1-acyl-sn-glycerol-3-phosphate acyltransferase [Myxococcus sp. CA033]|uniref:1-acyl-sn-glycerol-3-phosphate acyltransferase n=1 Tax=Myxococcus sp. CA033 TaxID=2741516 RepID=UPI00157B163B|nr:lysophospholipid acyltransferase family protein [Myxococcus sp. CA033]NTX37120.1 1-acyl-sn-glycerol-3-phosphate acyltransferase [Myxococcus sp. CA033]